MVRVLSLNSGSTGGNMKRICIIQHVPYETPGCIEYWIKNKSYRPEIIKIYSGEPLPAIENTDWLIVMGGPMSVHDTGIFPWLAGEKKFISRAIASGKIVIGICLGAQLVAEVLGGRVRRNEFREIGWYPVSRSGTGTGSKLTAMFADAETVFHWHGDTFEIPDGASHEFASEACRNQCFVYNEKVLALQFHIEVTGSLLEGMILNGKEELVAGKYIQESKELLDGAVNIKRNNDLMYSILDELDRL